MKTLDEVIKAVEEKLGIGGEEAIENCLETDALHYLKVFRAEREHLDELHRELVKENDNNPLTWEELQQMEGKPVWIEDDTGTKFYRGWAIVLNFIFNGTYLHYVCDDYSETCVVKDDLGKTWQAYRKELKNV